MVYYTYLWKSRPHLYKNIKTNMAKKLMIHSTHITFGVFLIILGLLLFARQMGFVAADFPVWPVVLVAFGVILVAGEMSK